MSKDLRGNVLPGNHYLGTPILKQAVKLTDLPGIPPCIIPRKQNDCVVFSEREPLSTNKYYSTDSGPASAERSRV